MVTARDILKDREPEMEPVPFTLDNLTRLKVPAHANSAKARRAAEEALAEQEAFFYDCDLMNENPLELARRNARKIHESYLERTASEDAVRIADNAVFEQASRNMTQSNLPVTDLARNAINEFVAEHRYDLANVGTGIKHFFARRKLKKALDQAVYMECGLRHSDDNNYKATKGLADEVFERLIPRSEKMADMYLTSDEVGGADLQELVDVSINTCTTAVHKDLKLSAEAVQDHVMIKYGTPDVGPIADLLEPEADMDVYAAPGFFAKVATYARATAAAVAVALTFGAAVPADNTVQYTSRVADDNHIVYANAADDVFVSYATEAREAPAPVDAPAPAPRERRHTRTNAPADNAPTDAHRNPRAENMPRVHVSDALAFEAYALANANGVEETAQPRFRSEDSARLNALASGVAEWDFDSSRLELAPDYSMY